MRVKRVSPESFATMVRATGKFCKFVKLPSTVGEYVFTGLMMSNDIWVSWPDNLTDEETKLYIQMYGEPSDLANPGDKITFNTKEAQKRRENEDQDKPTS